MVTTKARPSDGCLGLLMRLGLRRNVFDNSMAVRIFAVTSRGDVGGNGGVAQW